MPFGKVYLFARLSCPDKINFNFKEGDFVKQKATSGKNNGPEYQIERSLEDYFAGDFKTFCEVV